jgi:hypothetical protein
MKIRASQIGKLMATPRSKGESLSQTAKTYIQELVLEHKYGIRKEFWSQVHGQRKPSRRRSNKFC